MCARLIWLWACALLAGLLACGCAGLEKGQYGVDAVDFEGVDQMSDRAIATCLLTVERASFGIPLGLSQSECNAPPFDSSTPELELFRWPWTEWPVLNPAVVEVDKRRIERWYRARGFYDARVTDVRYEPKEAAEPDPVIPPGACDPERETCSARVVFVVEEGEPLRIGKVSVAGCEQLPNSVQELIAEAELPQLGARFDELDYDHGKASLAEQLAEASYAGAEIAGEVVLDHAKKTAQVTYRITPGPSYRFGEIEVVGQGNLQTQGIRAAAAIERGRKYRQSALTEVQQEVYALGAFSAVEVERKLDPRARRVHLIVKVTPLPAEQWRLGVGVTSGALQRHEGGEMESVPQWDVHLLARYERRHIFGTLGKLRIEDRPRLIFQDSFPSTEDPALGNLLRVRVNEPGWVEARTDLILETQWDYGPEPFLCYFRHDIMARLSGKRGFLRRKLFGTLALQQDRSIVPEGEEDCDGSPAPTGYAYSYLEQNLILDLRDSSVQPRKGIYAGVRASEAVRTPASDFSMLQFQPELRGYVPLPLYMVIAARFAIGMSFLLDASRDVDAVSQVLGPTAYRLRGGGAQSNRGFQPGMLGAGLAGGLRRWEGSVELRIRLGSAFGVVGFFDVGDVDAGEYLAPDGRPVDLLNGCVPEPFLPVLTPVPLAPACVDLTPDDQLRIVRDPRLRFDRPNPSVGFGLRYLTIVGAIRFDVGFVLGDPGPGAEKMPLLFDEFGAMHLTIGEAF